MRVLIALGLVGLALGVVATYVRAPQPPGRDAIVSRAERDVLLPLVKSHAVVTAGRSPASQSALSHDGAMELVEASGLVETSSQPDSGAPTAGEGAVSPARRIDQLIAVGFDRARAEEILKQEGQLRLAAAYDEYKVTGTMRPFNGAGRSATSQRLRAQLGDADYERYLQAIGQPTRVRVGDVPSNSAAANAGLLPGDEILTYAGQRIFNSRELQALTQRGSSGELVALSVMRDGYPMKLYVNGGSLGSLSAQ
jgi:S1-C subfamily serine protease